MSNGENNTMKIIKTSQASLIDIQAPTSSGNTIFPPAPPEDDGRGDNRDPEWRKHWKHIEPWLNRHLDTFALPYLRFLVQEALETRPEVDAVPKGKTKDGTGFIVKARFAWIRNSIDSGDILSRVQMQLAQQLQQSGLREFFGPGVDLSFELEHGLLKIISNYVQNKLAGVVNPYSGNPLYHEAAELILSVISQKDLMDLARGMAEFKLEGLRRNKPLQLVPVSKMDVVFNNLSKGGYVFTVEQTTEARPMT